MDSEGVPEGWALAGAAPNDYAVVLLEEDRRATAVLRAKTLSPRGFGTLMQAFEPEGLRGRRVRLAGFARAEEVRGWAGLWMRVDGPRGEVLGFDNMRSRALQGTTARASHAVVLYVPDDAAVVAFGVLLDGAGAVAVDGLSVEVVGDEVPVTAPTKALPRAPRNLGFRDG